MCISCCCLVVSFCIGGVVINVLVGSSCFWLFCCI